MWSYYYLPLGRATQVRPDAVPLARRWLPVVSMVTYSFQLDVLHRDIRDFPKLLVVWQPYGGMGDESQSWVRSGRPLFGRDLWVHYLNEIEPLCLRLAARTLGLHQEWHEETEPRGVRRKTQKKAKIVDWHLQFLEQYADWQRGGQLVESEAIDSLAYLQRFQEEYGGCKFMRPSRDARNDLIDTLRAQLAGTEAQLAEAREALDALRATQATVERTDAAGASSSLSLTRAVARVKEVECDLIAQSDELQSALAWEASAHAEVTELSQQLSGLQTQASQKDADLPWDVMELHLTRAVAREKEVECDLIAQSDELQSALAWEASAHAEVTELSQQLSGLQTQASQKDADLPWDVMELHVTLSSERCNRVRERTRLAEERREERRQWEEERGRLVEDRREECHQWEEEHGWLSQQALDVRASLVVSERLRQVAEDRYRHGRERAVQQGRASAYSTSFIATSSQYERNVEEGRAAQGSTGSRASMRPPAPRSAADPGEVESSHR
ncbi:hypothetical protein Taro_052798 [Colocasia esculenta]|uniref:Uncharacterized protein n=1 Tax=Colocasia esculenta TaxID=4460 RepID=A0A843XLA2_COLES|nr:hypothetical protein [Colocasia esculenta]